ncbi:MAG: hypothetical protein IT159_00160 [Bryobacterales bacterium]|nr:hypothetical protein [Bryobacterales bacterium]
MNGTERSCHACSGGSAAVTTDWLRSVGSKYLPYGQEAAATGQDRTKFATYYRDETTSFDYARNRYYSTFTARFTTPDPYAGSARPGNPQSRK